MSSSTVTPVGTHRLTDAATRVEGVLAEVADAPAWSLTQAEVAPLVVMLARARAGLDELWLRVLAAADRSDVAALTAATSLTAWLAHATVSPPGAAKADVQLAAALDGHLAATRTALATGVIDVERARVIAHTVQTLPDDAVAAEPGLPARAEAHLLELAQEHDARKLKALAPAPDGGPRPRRR